MRRFTKQELELLKEAEIHFLTVRDGQYKRATGWKLNTLVADLYDKATGEKIDRNFGCGVCCFNIFKKVGEKYFADKKYYETVETELEPKVVIDTLSTDNEEIDNNKATNKDKENDSEGKGQRNKGNARASQKRSKK